MAVTVASLQAVLDLDKKGFDSGLKKAESSLGSFKSTLGGLLSTAGGFLAASAIQTGLSLITSSITESVAAAREAIAVDKQLEAVLRSTGGAAGVTADAARDLADSLSRVTNFDDDAILGGENLLLTFTKIGKDVFPQATETMLDMSQAMGQDLKSSAIQLGKALNDPVKGMTALQRVGVTFSAQQKEQIKDFARQGELAKAQQVILDELATEFGGSARALADPIIQLGNAFGNLQEKFGANVLLPILNSLGQVVLPGLNNAIDSFKLSISSLTEQELASLQQTFTDLIGVLSGIFSAFNELGKGIVSVATGLGLADENSTGLGLTITALGKVLGALLQPIQLITGVINILGAALQAIGGMLKFVTDGYRLLSSAISDAASKSSVIMTVWNALTAAGTTLMQIIEIIRIAWLNLINAMMQPLTLPAPVTPGSPTPLEMGLRGIGDAIKTMPDIGSMFGGSIPTAAGAGGGGSTTNINLGGQSFSFSGNNQQDQAIIAMVQYLRGQLNR